MTIITALLTLVMDLLDVLTPLVFVMTITHVPLILVTLSSDVSLPSLLLMTEMLALMKTVLFPLELRKDLSLVTMEMYAL